MAKQTARIRTVLNNLLVFDIETIPDINACKGLIGSLDESLSVQEKRELLTQYHLDITDGQNSFLRQPFHQVVAISILTTSIERDGDSEFYALKEIRSGGNINSTEKELVKGFFQYIASLRPRIVSFNGRTFDLPVLKYRAMVHGIAAEYLYKAGDKWNNYMQRYSLDWHCDLLEALSDFGASARVKMNEVCSILGLPGKLGVDGSQVATMYDDGKIQEIRNYCETDVINTYLIYLRLMHHQGRTSHSQYNRSVEDLLKFLENSLHQHFQSFYKAWNSTEIAKLG